MIISGTSILRPDRANGNFTTIGTHIISEKAVASTILGMKLFGAWVRIWPPSTDPSFSLQNQPDFPWFGSMLLSKHAYHGEWSAFFMTNQETSLPAMKEKNNLQYSLANEYPVLSRYIVWYSFTYLYHWFIASQKSNKHQETKWIWSPGCATPPSSL